MKVLRYLIPLVVFVVQACATITNTNDVAGPYIMTSLSSGNPVYFPSGIPFQQSSDLLLVDVGQSSAPRSPAVVLSPTGDYTVAGGGYNTTNQMQTGTIKMVYGGTNAVLANDTIYVIHNSPANQLSVFANSGYLTASMIEQGLDKSAVLAQQALNGNAISLHVESWETKNAVPPNLTMTLAARAGKYLGFDSGGNVIFTSNTGNGGGGGGGSGITAVNGTTNQITAITTANVVTLSTPQNIDTGAAVQFGSLGIGIAPSVSVPINFQPSVTDSGGTGKAVRISPTIFQSQSGDAIYNTILGGTINSNSYTNGNIYELTLGSPTTSGSYNTGYQLYLAGLNSGTFTTKYGIFQNGTETNQLNNLKLTPSGGGAITFADGTVQSTAASGTGGGVTSIVAGTGITTNASTGSVTITNSGVTNLVQGSGITLNAAAGSVTISASGTAGVTTANGTANQVLVNGTSGTAQTGAITLTTPQNIDTAANVQFGTLGIGTTVGAGNGVNLQPSVTASAGQSKGLRISPSITGAANGDSLYDTIIGGTISTSFTSSNLYELILGAPTVTGSYSNGYQLYLSGLSSGTYSNKYGIYQAGTEANVFGGSVTVPAFTATGTTTLATSLTGYLYSTSGVVSAVTTIPTSSLSGTISLTSQVSGTLPVANGGTGVTTSTGTGSNVLSASPTFTGTLTAANLTATGTTTLATSLTGYLSASSGVVSASSTIPTTALSGTITNAQLANSSITIAGTSTALGGSISQDTITGLSTTGLVKRTAANTLAIASSGTDYAPATSGTSLLYGNGSGGFSNATVSSTNLTFSSGTLNTIQNIATTSSPQFSSLGIGVAASGTAGDLYVNNTLSVGAATIAGAGLNISPSVTASSGNVKTIRVSPTMTAAANGDSLYNIITGGSIVGGAFTTLGWYGLGVGTPTISTGSLTNAYGVYISPAPTATNQWGIYQSGTGIKNHFDSPIDVASTAVAKTNQNLTPATSTISASAIDWSVSNSFYKTLGANTTFTFSNAVDGQVITICLLNTTSNYTVTWPTIKWAGGTAPTMTTGAHYDVYTIYYNATVGAYFGSYVQNF